MPSRTNARLQNAKARQGGVIQLLRRIAPNLFNPPLGSKPWGDLSGSLTGALASIPQTLAYGLIVGTALGGTFSSVGVLVALYGSVVVGLAAVLLGGCPFLVAGPRAATLLVFTALISQLTHSAALSHLSNPAPVALALACVAVFLCGMLQVIFGIFRLGRLASYVPLPVVAGFVNGSALLIILSQVWAATGITAQGSTLQVFGHIDELKPAALALALATTASVRLLPRFTKWLPSALFAVVTGTAIYHFFAAFGYGPALGGTLPPPEDFSLRFLGNEALATLSGTGGSDLIRPMLLAALSMAILATLDTLLATSATDGLTMHRSDGGRQLMAEGIGNALAGMFGMSPGSGSMVRTQAALNGGMASAAAPIAIALITLVVTVALSPLIGMLSQAVMAGLLIALGIDLVDKWTLARVRRILLSGSGFTTVLSDLLVVAVVVGTTLAFDLATAVGIGVLLSLLSFVINMARSPIRRCYRATALIPQIYDDIQRRNFIETHGRGIAVIELEGALFFGTATELETRVEALANEGVVHVVLDMRRVKHIDATGARALERTNSKLSSRGGMLAVSYVDRERRQRQEELVGEDHRSHSGSRTNWIKLAYLGTINSLGENRFLSDTDAAVALCESHMAGNLDDDVELSELLSAHSPIMRSLDRSMLRRLRNYWSRIAYVTGDVVFSQDSPPDGVFFVAAGRVDVLINIPRTERKRKVQSLTVGSVFGEMALIDPKRRSASVIAVEPTTCYWMTTENFERLKLEQTDIAFKLISDVAMIFAERLRATNTMLAEMEA
jgi:SulP family sulfate permease